MEYSTLIVEVSGPIGRITLNRPECLNAVSGAMLRELETAAHWLDTQEDLRVVILSGKGRAFCAGADLRDPVAQRASAESGRPWLERRKEGYLGSRMADAIEGMQATTIVQLHGHVVGGGVVLASVCDFRIAAEDTRFAIPEIDMGIPLGWGAIPRLIRDIGPVRAKELVMTCRPFDAQEAKDIGFINTVVPESELSKAVEELAATLAAKPSVPIALTKAHMNAAAKSMVDGSSGYADGDLLLALVADPEGRAATMAYAEKTLKKK